MILNHLPVNGLAYGANAQPFPGSPVFLWPPKEYWQQETEIGVGPPQIKPGQRTIVSNIRVN